MATVSSEDTAPQAAGTGPRKLEGRVALVTGGIRGIGAAICDRLAARGVTVAAGYSRDKEAATRSARHTPARACTRATSGRTPTANG
jgi:NAD(P)-dependent dehydrogenase (short-subunit alcohol dehydrogenase family)